MNEYRSNSCQAHTQLGGLCATRRLSGIVFLVVLALAALIAPQVVNAAPEGAVNLPKLVVVIVVDGLPQEQVLKYRDQLGEGGFKKLLEEGAWFANAHYSHAMTETAVGHATILTGVQPSRHGIVGNDWTDSNCKEKVSSVKPSPCPDANGKRPAAIESPVNLRASTLGDELIDKGINARVVSISIKDRGAIFLGGRKGQAFWFDAKKKGAFVTSAYYGTTTQSEKLLSEFHKNSPQNLWFGQQWIRLKDNADYSRSAQVGEYVVSIPGLQKDIDSTSYSLIDPRATNGKTFPEVKEMFYKALIRTPMGDKHLLDFVKSAIEIYGLGKEKKSIPDLLAVSFSSHDYVNHDFGPESIESHDHFLQLDRTIADFLGYLKMHLQGREPLVVFTSDHGFSSAPDYCRTQMNLDADRIDPVDMLKKLNAAINTRFGTHGVTYAYTWQRPTVYLEYENIKGNGLKGELVEEEAAYFLRSYPGVHDVFTRTQLTHGPMPKTDNGRMVSNTWNNAVSGDVLVMPKRCWYLANDPKEVTAIHGSYWEEDTHVPLIFMGSEWVRPGKYDQSVEVVDIAPTLAHLLNIRPPPGGEGRVLSEILLSGKLQP